MNKKTKAFLIAAALSSAIFATVMTIIEAVFNPSEVILPFTWLFRVTVYPLITVSVLLMAVVDREWSWIAKLVATALLPFVIYVGLDLVFVWGDYFNFSMVAVINWLTPLLSSLGITFAVFTVFGLLKKTS